MFVCIPYHLKWGYPFGTHQNTNEKKNAALKIVHIILLCLMRSSFAFFSLCFYLLFAIILLFFCAPVSHSTTHSFSYLPPLSSRCTCYGSFLPFSSQNPYMQLLNTYICECVCVCLRLLIRQLISLLKNESLT